MKNVNCRQVLGVCLHFVCSTYSEEAGPSLLSTEGKENRLENPNKMSEEETMKAAYSSFSDDDEETSDDSYMMESGSSSESESDSEEAGPSLLCAEEKENLLENPNKMSEEEALEAAYSSFSDDDEETSDDSYMMESGSSSESESDNEFSPPPVTSPTTDEPTMSPVWKQNGQMNVINFTKVNQMLVPLPEPQPVNYFRLIFDDRFVNLIIEKTNSYANELLLSANVSEVSRIKRWEPLSTPEFMKFIGLLLHTGTIKIDSLKDYWSSSRILNIPYFAKNMSRNRFLLIMRCLRFGENLEDGQGSSANLYKGVPVIELFNRKMEEIYSPGKELCLDDSMILWRGRVFLRDYATRKPRKYNMKLYMLTEPNGIVLNVHVNDGPSDDQSERRNFMNIVLELMKNKLNVGHSIYLENLYTSCQLAEELLKKDTYSTGFLKNKRKGNCKEVIETKLKRGETVARYSNKNIMFGKWKVYKQVDVLYISTEHKNEMVEYTDKRGNAKNKPLPILKYDQFMSCTDRQDQMIDYYPCQMVPLRWYKKLGLHIIHICLLNAHALYNNYSGKKLSLYDFRLSVIKDLVQTTETATILTSKVCKQLHYPKRIAEKSNKGETVRKRCRQTENMKKDPVLL